VPVELEVISLKQCGKMLGKYQIVFVTYEGLDLGEYINILEDTKTAYRVEYFPKIYFYGIAGYNALMCSNTFYDRFLNDEYILIYQLDAYVFSSELDYWLNQNYDYTGGPFFKETKDLLRLEWSGYYNGGFSIRRTGLFYRLSFTKNIKYNYYFWLLLQKRKGQIHIFGKVGCIILHMGVRILSLAIKARCGNEDLVWSSLIKNRGGALPSFEAALSFAFDNYHVYAWQLNQGKLPFGCHGWDIFYSYQFWEEKNLIVQHRMGKPSPQGCKPVPSPLGWCSHRLSHTPLRAWPPARKPFPKLRQ
jgi:hypothetical protein